MVALFIIILLVRHTTTIYIQPDNYDKSETPGKPANVRLIFKIDQVINIDDHKNELELQGHLTLVWNDTRIQKEDDGKDLILDPKVDTQHFWMPDVWIRYLIDFKTLKATGPLASLKIQEQHNMVYWQSISIKFSCEMFLSFYPMDIQKCVLEFSSNSLQTDKQIFHGQIRLTEKFQLLQGAKLYQVAVEEIFEKKNSGEACSLDKITGKRTKCWPMVAAVFRLERRWTSYLLYVFLPNIILVGLSWISFLVPPYIVPGRMVLLITIVIVLFNQYSKESGKSPPSNGLKVQDFWFIGCTFFILAAILEYAACLYIKREALQQKKNHAKEASPAKVEGIQKQRSRSSSSSDMESNTPVFVIRKYSASLDLKKRPGKTCKIKQMSEVSSFQSPDSGEGYGDINDKNMEKEEMLECLDRMAFKIFPLIFCVYLVIFFTITFTLRYVIVY